MTKSVLDAFDAATFGELYADEYDERHNPGTIGMSVELLSELAAGRKTLELAIGTGRIALPLSEQGLEIHGIEGSPDMVAKLKEKPGGGVIPVTVADMADFRVDDAYGFIFLVFNTFYNLKSQEAQVNCFRCSAEHLVPGGHFLLELFVPDTNEFGPGVRTRELDAGSVVLEATRHDPLEQTVEYQRVLITNESVRLRPLAMRYAWPAEIDLMARLAGLELAARWGGWDRSPFTAKSDMHISLYRKGHGKGQPS